MSVAIRTALIAFAVSSFACVREKTTEVRVREPQAVGVEDAWLVRPGEGGGALGPGRVERSPWGAIVYRYRRGARFDAPLVDGHGRITSIAAPPELEAEEAAARIEHERLLPLPVDWQTVERQVPRPAKIDLVTSSRNVEEVRTVGKPSRFIGAIAAVTGASFLAAGVTDGVDRFDDPPSATRTGLFVVDGTFAALGAVLVTVGAWYLFAPEEQSVVFRPVE